MVVLPIRWSARHWALPLLAVLAHLRAGWRECHVAVWKGLMHFRRKF